MLKAPGIENRADLALLASIIILVAVTPLGHEATHPFVGLCGLVLCLMLVSVRWNPGSQFDGLYRWYQQLLFGGAFLAMTQLNCHRTMHWKRTILWSVVTIDLMYL